MRSLLLTLSLALACATLLSACSKEEKSTVTASKPPAIQAAQQAAAVADLNNGQKVYASSCAACHDTGLMGAPKIGDEKAWAGHQEHGMEHMVSNAISGIGKMPPKGGNMKLTDAEVRAAVEYMVGKH